MESPQYETPVAKDLVIDPSSRTMKWILEGGVPRRWRPVDPGEFVDVEVVVRDYPCVPYST